MLDTAACHGTDPDEADWCRGSGSMRTVRALVLQPFGGIGKLTTIRADLSGPLVSHSLLREVAALLECEPEETFGFRCWAAGLPCTLFVSMPAMADGWANFEATRIYRQDMLGMSHPRTRIRGPVVLLPWRP